MGKKSYFCHPLSKRLESRKNKRIMQKRHTDRRTYFKELANTSRNFYIDYVQDFIKITPETRVLEVGCGEGGNLAPFSEKGCTVLGIDINSGQIDNARKFFLEDGLQGTFICSDFNAVPIPENTDEKYDLVLIHDVIEHVEPPYKETFFEHIQCFMKPGAIAFFGFPAWQMPFGGHQQICRSRVSKLPFIHLLSERAYRRLLTRAGEAEGTIEELFSIRRSKMPIEKFEALVRQSKMQICRRTFWVINPHYKQKFGLIPLREIWPFTKLPYVRNFYTTSAWYILRAQ